MNSQSFKKRAPVALVGANGYVGTELARLLLRHPGLELVACYGRDDSWSLKDFLPESKACSVPILNLESLVSSAHHYETIFLATPHEVSHELTPQLLEKKVQVVDLSGAFRLELDEFHQWYQTENPAQFGVSLDQVHFGLSPWSQVGSYRPLISNPGCYATSVMMALIPLLKEGLIQSESLVIDAKSGTSGAGYQAKKNLLYNEVEGECLPYRVGQHQHIPEIRRFVKKFSDQEIEFHFSTSLLAARRGIISSIYATLSPSLQGQERNQVLQQISNTYEKFYQNYPLLRHSALGKSEATDRMLLSLKKVVGSARTQIAYQVVGNRLYLFSLIDNLLKGAASQAIENWNDTHGLPLETGLIEVEGVL